ncbi:MAG TPA: RraA family protein [Ramlibacter sp.]|uniref:RraA family protein n=1 Tax=Ramlibacter sp. TaxID=1917967 RepID=UPI002C3A05B6|nr:RraA family protein [Ramlibacter sp.]HVZ44903.1 RraA family protein [Ramlibacter sp.]
MTQFGARRQPSAPQADAKLIELVRGIPVPLLSDNIHRGTGSVGLRAWHKPTKSTMAGTAVTVRTRGGDNLAVLRAFDFCRPGDVLVIDAGGDLTNAVIGGIMTAGAAMLGLAGVVVDGAIRDAGEIGEREFPVFARGTNHRGPYKNGPGEINVAVNVGGMIVQPGDIVVGDLDGLLAFPAADAPAVIDKALAQQKKEEWQMEEIRSGRWDRSFLDALEAKAIN